MSQHTFRSLLRDEVQAVFDGLRPSARSAITQHFLEKMEDGIVPIEDPIVQITLGNGSPWIYIEFRHIEKTQPQLISFSKNQAGAVSVLAKRLDGRFAFLQEMRPRAGRVLSLPGGCMRRDMRYKPVLDQRLKAEIIENGLRELLEEARCVRTEGSEFRVIEFPLDADVVAGNHFLLQVDRVRYLGNSELEDGVERVLFANRAEMQRFLSNGTRMRNASIAGLIIGMGSGNTPTEPVRALVDSLEFSFEDLEAEANKAVNGS